MTKINLTNFNSAPLNLRTYSGNAGNKYGVKWQDENWIIKFPKTTRDLHNPQLSYTTSPLSEYLGSKIYESFGIPVHETLLGYRQPENGRQNKLVVACKDFRGNAVQLSEFKEIKNAQFFSNGDEGTSGVGTNLSEVLETIEISPFFEGLRDAVRERFWDMFIVDFVIGNNDRNNTNWGLLIDDAGKIELAPVYDNGNAFFNKRGSEQFEKRLSDERQMREDAYGTLISVYTDDAANHIHPSELIASRAYEQCDLAVKRFFERYDFEKITEIFDTLPSFENELVVLPEKQKDFYLKLIELRVNEVLLPVSEEMK